MKRILCLLLAMVMLVSLLSGCGGKQEETVQAVPEMESVMETTAASATELITEPTLSAEEVLYNSLPDRTKQAVDVGIVELEQLTDLNRIVTVGEAAAMLQKAYVHRTGVESKTLNEMMTNPDYSERNADRGWVLPIPGAADMELVLGGNYKDYAQWVKYLNAGNTSLHIWSQFDDRLGITGTGWHDMEEDDSLFDSQVFMKNVFAADEKVYFEAMGEGSVYGPSRPQNGYRAIANYGLIVYDSTNGKRYFTLEVVDGKEYYNPTEELTVADVAEYALIYYNYPNPMEYPEFVAPEEVGTYNPDIITEELLTKQTTLPEPTCQNLPSDWRGVVMDDMDFVHINHHLDFEVYEYEIQLVKEAGFNYIGLNLDFSYLQDYLLFANRYDSDKIFKSIVNAEDAGKLSVQRLKELDRVLALCMENDIHVNLRATGLPNYFASYKQRHLENSQNLDQTLAAMWQAIARRYADIPNEYLSFTIFAGDDETEPTDEMLLPSIDAIRLESPDRCIIAEICHAGMVSAKYAEKGVALSYRMGKNTSDVFYLGYNYFTSQGQIYWWGSRGAAFVNQFSWPYQGTVDAAVLLDSGKGETCRTVMETAQAYGVGFTLSEFGVSYPPLAAVAIYPRARYADEHYHAMIRDITSTVEELGYGWCFAHWYSPYGVTFCLPVVQDAVYEQVEDYPCYVDQGMMGLFREINGVS